MRTALRMLGRGLLKRCARCGSGGLFRRWFTMVERCPRCGLLFEREEGQWVGAMIVNFTVTEIVFVVALVGGLMLTWPDVPWVGLTVVGVATNVVVPIVFYPTSKTIWVGIDLLMHRDEQQLEWRAEDGPGTGDAVSRGPTRC